MICSPGLPTTPRSWGWTRRVLNAVSAHLPSARAGWNFSFANEFSAVGLHWTAQAQTAPDRPFDFCLPCFNLSSARTKHELQRPLTSFKGTRTWYHIMQLDGTGVLNEPVGDFKVCNCIYDGLHLSLMNHTCKLPNLSSVNIADQRRNKSNWFCTQNAESCWKREEL